MKKSCPDHRPDRCADRGPDRTDPMPDHCPDRRSDPCSYLWPDRTEPWPDRCQDHQPDRCADIGQNEQTEIRVFARPNRPKYGYSPDRTDQNIGIGQTEQTEIWILARPNRPKYGYWPDRTDRNMGIGQIEQTEIAIGQTAGATQIFSRPLWTVAPDPPVRDPSRSDQYLSWVADLILGELSKSGADQLGRAKVQHD